MAWSSLTSFCRRLPVRRGLFLLAVAAICAAPATPRAQAKGAAAAIASPRAEFLRRLGVERWHVAGCRGQGVKVAVLDSGFRGYRAFLGSVLPRHVTVRSFRNDGNLEARDSQHGILCGEVIHALAPEAELLFANWEPDRPDRFLDAVRWARQQGAKVVSCSLIMPSWSDGEGGGVVNETLARIAGNGRNPSDLLCFASAGNTAQRHWCGRFHSDASGCHQWRSGQVDNPLSPWGNERVSVELYGRVGGEYELSVYDQGTKRPVGQAVLRGLPNDPKYGCAVVRFQPEAGRSYVVRLRRLHVTGAAKDESLHLVALGAGLEHSTARGSVACPADGPGVLAVGAVDEDGRRLFYSSCGGARCPKPDFVAEVPFPSLWRERAFSGTSATAPQAAAIAALWWSRHADWTADDVRAAMRRSARDLGPPGHDCETGHGRLLLP
jgi:subtilisin family serine protease